MGLASSSLYITPLLFLYKQTILTKTNPSLFIYIYTLHYYSFIGPQSNLVYPSPTPYLICTFQSTAQVIRFFFHCKSAQNCAITRHPRLATPKSLYKKLHFPLPLSRLPANSLSAILYKPKQNWQLNSGKTQHV